jgi:hypothetical protein
MEQGTAKEEMTAPNEMRPATDVLREVREARLRELEAMDEVERYLLGDRPRVMLSDAPRRLPTDYIDPVRFTDDERAAIAAKMRERGRSDV